METGDQKIGEIDEIDTVDNVDQHLRWEAEDRGLVKLLELLSTLSAARGAFFAVAGPLIGGASLSFSHVSVHV